MELAVEKPVQTPPEGATGEPAKPAAASSQDVNLDELIDSLPAKEPAKAPARAELDEDFRKKLESLDPRDLPDAVRSKLEAPFLSLRTKQTTEWDQERQRYLAMIEKLSNRPDVGGEPAADAKEELRDKIANGDLGALEQFVDQRFTAKYGSKIQELDLQNAGRVAASLYPESAQMEGEIAATLKENPGIAYVLHQVLPRDQKLAGTLIAGIAKNIRYDALEQKFKALESSRKDDIKAAIEAYKQRVAGLPSSGLKAGTGQSGAPAPGNLTLRQAMEAAWQEHGGE